MPAPTLQLPAHAGPPAARPHLHTCCFPVACMTPASLHPAPCSGRAHCVIRRGRPLCRIRACPGWRRRRRRRHARAGQPRVCALLPPAPAPDRRARLGAGGAGAGAVPPPGGTAAGKLSASVCVRPGALSAHTPRPSASAWYPALPPSCQVPYLPPVLPLPQAAGPTPRCLRRRAAPQRPLWNRSGRSGGRTRRSGCASRWSWRWTRLPSCPRTSRID